MKIVGKRHYEPLFGYGYADFRLEDDQDMTSVKIWRLASGRFGVQSSEFSSDWVINVVDYESAVGCVWYLKHILRKLGLCSSSELSALLKRESKYRKLRDFLYGDNRFDKMAGTQVFNHIREGLPEELRWLLPSIDQTREFKVCWE